MATDVAAPVTALRALADPLRWRIVELLAAEDLCVCHLVEQLRVPQPLVSHHLKVLREADLVETERFRYWTYYRLCPEILAALGDQLCRLADQRAPLGNQRRPCC
ncbi:MAG TPA: metalloregulator ArsR/SmtB family transcription factor [Acidimicrobiales bacterium]|nr:metalloregulator ArsR/SmtB family transcription factor [Acidimicrobiales bacterium]